MDISSHYRSARERLLTQAACVEARIDSIQHPLRGPGHEKLYVDLVQLGPESPSKMLVTMSGTHGVEGLCGAEIQQKTLSLYADQSLPEDTGLLMVHAINPYGFAWLRRCNEDGVDLCRNFVDFASTPDRPIYDRLVDAVVPKQWAGPVRQAADSEIASFIAQEGFDTFANNIALGQYRYWQAPFYGGRVPVWSNIVFREICRNNLASCKHVFMLDFHTGLGEWGAGELLCFHKPGTEAEKRVRDCWGDKVTSVFNAEETVAYPLSGGILEGMEQELSEINLSAACLEFGTLDPMTVFTAVRADHWLHSYSDFEDDDVTQVKNGMLAAFYCDDDEWRAITTEQAMTAQEQALNYLSAAR